MTERTGSLRSVPHEALTGTVSTVAARDLPRTPGVDADWIVSAWTWALLLAVVLWTRVDPDLWGHVRYGLDWLETRTLPYEDPYSFTQDRPWINHEWLSEGVMALAYASAGVGGLIVLKLLLVTAALGTLAWTLRGLPVLWRSACLSLVTLSAITSITFTVRPHLWSWLLAILLARLLLSPPSARLLGLVPVIFLVWTNTHGGVVIGVGLLMVWTLSHLWHGREPRRLTVAIAGAALASTVVNPYGLELPQFLAETVRIGRGTQEWQPIWRAQFAGSALPWLLTSAGVLALACSKERPRFDRLAVMIALAIASERTMRLVPFYAVVSAIYAAPSLQALAARGRGVWALRAPSRSIAVISLAPMLIVAAVVHRPIWASIRQCLPIQGEWIPDLAVADALKEAAPSGRLVTPYGWGQYVIWHLGPRLLVSYDGRRETVYTSVTDLRQVEIERGTAEGIAFLEHTRPEYVWLSNSSAPVREWLRSQPDYRIDIETHASFLGVRKDLPLVPMSARTPSFCFPG